MDTLHIPRVQQQARSLHSLARYRFPPSLPQDHSETPGGSGTRSGVTFGRSTGGGGGRGKSSYGGGGSSRSNNNHDDDGRPSLASLGSALRRQAEDAALKVVTLQRSGVGIVAVLRKMEAAVHALSTKDLFWKVCSRLV